MITNHSVLAALACLVAVGCGGGGVSRPVPRTTPVSGTVLFNGKPASGVKVTFHPQFDMEPTKFTPHGETDKDGRFTPSTAAPSDGAPPGDYVVTFEMLRAGTDRRGLDVEVDAWRGKYADPAKSAWKVTIKDGDNTLEPFKLD